MSSKRKSKRRRGEFYLTLAFWELDSPAFRALSADGFLRSRIEPSDAGPPRRYYRITKEGRALLRHWSGIWSQTRDFVDRFLRGVES